MTLRSRDRASGSAMANGKDDRFFHSLTENKAVINGKKWYKYIDGYLCPDLLHKIHPLQYAAFDADCLTALRILKIITVSPRMDSGNAFKTCYIL